MKMRDSLVPGTSHKYMTTSPVWNETLSCIVELPLRLKSDEPLLELVPQVCLLAFIVLPKERDFDLTFPLCRSI